MVYKRNKKSPKVSYVERVLGAFSQVQREHRKHAVHLATLRAQVKKNAQAKEDELGPYWTHWVSKAVGKLEHDGIFEPAATVGSVALTPNGKKTIANIRRVIKNSRVTPEANIRDDRIWKHVASLGTKRSRRQSKFGDDGSEEETTPARSGSVRKRPRLSTSPVNKSKVAQVENSRIHDLLRDTSPLTVLGSEGEGEEVAAQLRELREREDELEEMRRELAAARRRPSTGESEADGNIRFATPSPSIDFDRTSSPISPITHLFSRNYPGRTQSGSLIPNLSKQPTPAPSSPDRDLNDNQRTDGPNFDSMDIDTESLGPFASHSSHGRTVSPQQGTLRSVSAAPFNGGAQTATSRGQFNSENQSITSLKLDIKHLRQQLLTAGISTSVSEERSAGKMAGVGKATPEELQALRSAIAERDTTIGALKCENENLQAEVADIREELRAVEPLVQKLTAEREANLAKLRTLEVSNGNLLRSRAGLQNEFALAQAEYSEVKNLNESLQSQHGVLAAENESLKLREAEGASRMQNLLESLSQAANDTFVLQEQKASLEISVSKYLVEAQENERIVQKLRNEAKDKDTYIDGLSVQLKTLNRSTEENLLRLTEKESIIKALSEEIRSAQDRMKALEATLAAKLDELRAEKDQKLQLAQQLADKEESLQAEKQTAFEARLMIERYSSELTVTENSIERLTSEIFDARRLVTGAEDNLIESRRKYEEERAGLLTQVSELQHAFEVEHGGKSALEAGMVSYVAKIQDLEAQLADIKSAKNLEEMRTCEMRNLFANLRKSQEKLFDEIEGKIVSEQSPVEKRVSVPLL